MILCSKQEPTASLTVSGVTQTAASNWDILSEGMYLSILNHLDCEPNPSIHLSLAYGAGLGLRYISPLYSKEPKKY
jgi:hypothetical protein